MNGNGAQHNSRAVAEIESDLLKAEEAFADADNRVKEAERDRRTALDTINNCQMEFDKAIAELRQRSAAGSKWHLEMGGGEKALILKPEDIGEHEIASQRSNEASVVEQFDRLRAAAQSEGDEGPQSEGCASESPGFRIVGPRPASSSGT